MYRLLRAHFSRLTKNKVFWLCVFSVFLINVLNITNYYRFTQATDAIENAALETHYFDYVPTLGILSAIVISLFFGTEYSDGTMRNKLIIGSTRTNIYLSSVVTSAFVSAAITLTCFIGGLVGIPLLGVWTMPLSSVLLYILAGVLSSIALSAILTLISINCSRKAEGAVIAIMTALALMILASVIYNKLQEPKMISEMIMTANGIKGSEPHLNPSYIGGSLRSVFTVLQYILPTGQSILIANLELIRPLQCICYSIGLTIVVTVCGAIIFRKKDLK